MVGFHRTAALIVTTLLVGCGSSCPRTADDESNASSEAASAEPKPESHSEASEETERTEKADKDEREEREEGQSATSSASASSSSASSESQKGTSGEPQFPEHASVAQAIAAVPVGTERANIDPETLATPLQDPSLYEPCKPGTQHFKIKVAVWDGHAVGVDVSTPNKKLAECVDERVRSIEWKKKVKSLNTVEYAL